MKLQSSETKQLSDIEIIKFLVLDLSKLVIIFNKDLKNGIIHNFVSKSDLIFSRYIKIYPDLNKIIVSDSNFGLNIEITGITWKVLFPAFLFKSPFRLQIIKELKFYFNQEITFNDFQKFISKKFLATENVKKGGFTNRTLEVLRFYMTFFKEVIDDDVYKFLPYYENYKAKYIHLRLPIVEKRFPLTQKYSTYYLMPKFRNFGLNGVMIHNDENFDLLSDDLNTLPFGLLFNDQKRKEFSFFFIPYNRKCKNNFIEKISFFENLDLFQKDYSLKKYTNKTINIIDVYYDYKEGNFKDTAIIFENEFIKSQKLDNQINDLDLIIHLFNTRKLPYNHEIHPISKHLIMYRNKIVNFYATTNYFIYIYDIKGKTLTRYFDLLMNLIRNTFSNGYIIQSRTQLLISTFLFKKDFENQKESFVEFIYSFKLEIQIFENLNLVPFSFYQLPSSCYFETESSKWNFPFYQEQSINDLMTHQIQNLELERSRLQNNTFRKRIQDYLENWTNKITALKEN